MKKFALLLTLIAFVAVQVVSAQSKVVTGTVTAADDGTTLPGVSIVVKGTSIGTISDVDGKYSINVPEDATTLVFSFVGMKSVESPITGSVVNAVLTSESIGVEEIIVTGYGNTTQESFTGSAVSVKGETLLKEASPVSADRALQGYVSGVRVTQTGGQPGSSATIQIRGIGSINGNTTPLYVVDGLPMLTGDFSSVNTSSNVLASLNPADIESMTVLKDAAATSLYGSRGANGVVIITTKQGKKGATKIDVTVENTWSDIAMPNELTGYYMDGREYTEYALEGLKNYYLQAYDYLPGQENGEMFTDADINASAMDYAYANLNSKAGIIHPDDPLDGSFDYSTADRAAYLDRARNTDWGDVLFRVGKEQKVDVSARGGDENSTHYFSLGYLNQDGIYVGSEFERLTGKMNITNKVNDVFEYKVGQSLSYTVQEGTASGAWYYSNPMFGMKMLNPTQPVYLDDAETVYNPYPGFSTSLDNFVQVNDLESSISKQFRSVSNVVGILNITDWLKFTSTNGIDMMIINEQDTRSIESPNGAETNGAIYSYAKDVKNITTSNLFNFNQMFGDHSVSGILGYEAKMYKYSYQYSEGKNYSTDKLLYLSNAATPSGVGGSVSDDRLVSYLGRVNYDYKDKYYASFSARRDGSSRLAADARWGNFWAVSAAWNLTREEFLSGVGFLDNLKLKASYGTNGNLPSSYYASQALYAVSGSYSSNPAVQLSSKGNPALSWEQSYTANAGVDFGMFGTLTGTLEYYNKKTDHLINEAPTSLTTGFSDQTVNKGVLRNTGVELSLSNQNISSGQFRWETDFNISYMKAMVEELEEPIDDFPYYTKEGEHLYSFRLREWAGVNPQTGQPMWYTNNENEDGSLTKDVTSNSSKANKTIVGKGYPDFFGGLTNRFSYGNFELAFLFTFTLGGELYDDNFYGSQSDGADIGSYTPAKAAAEDYWQKPGDITKDPIVLYNTSYNSHYNSNRRLKSSDHLRLKNLTFSYNLPKDLVSPIGIANARVFLQGNNLYTFYKYDYINPEIALDGTSSGANYFPMTKSLKVGLSIQF